MKVGIVCPYDLGAVGGVQQLCLELAERLRSTGDEVVLAAPGTGEWVSLGSIVPVIANGSRVPISLSGSAREILASSFDGVEVIHVHEPLVPRVGWAALGVYKPQVLTFHADPPAWARRAYRRIPKRLLHRMEAAEKTAVSDVARSAVPASWGPVEVIPNAIDVGSYRIDVPRRAKRVAFLGRDDPRKGLGVLLEAWPSVLAVHPDAELVVIGSARPSAPQGVQFAGRVRETEKRALLASSAVFAAPNLGGESFGIVIAEALAAGCAVVASDLPAFRAVAEHAATYVEPGDPAEWSETLITLLSSPDWVESLGKVAPRLANRFDWPVVLDAYRTVYRRAAESV